MYDFDRFDPIHKATFLSTNKRFAVKYAMSHHDDDLFLYMCKLIKPVNLFNIMSTNDRMRMRLYLESIDSKDDIMQIFNMMIGGERHIRRWNEMERDDLVKGYEALDYDGFTTTERAYADDNDKPYSENIALFDVTAIKILKQYTRDELNLDDYK
jgi:hypothetical protein